MSLVNINILALPTKKKEMYMFENTLFVLQNDDFTKTKKGLFGQKFIVIDKTTGYTIDIYQDWNLQEPLKAGKYILSGGTLELSNNAGFVNLQIRKPTFSFLEK